MRKTLLSACLACFAMGAFAAGMPEELYIVGSMNNWTTPDMAFDSELITIPSTGEEGRYATELDIPAGSLEFKIFKSKTGWGDPDEYYGAYSNQSAIQLYNNLDCTLDAMQGNSSLNFNITNWNGGKLKISCRMMTNPYNDSLDLVVILEGENQPSYTTPVDRVYVIGDFNNWKLPEGSTLNGAYELSSTSESAAGLNFECPLIDFPEGDTKFMFYYKNSVSGKDVYVGSKIPPFGIYSSQNNFTSYITLYGSEYQICSEKAEAVPFCLTGWNGNKVSIFASFPLEGDPNSFSIYGTDAPANVLEDGVEVMVETTSGPAFSGSLDDYGVFQFTAKSGTVKFSHADTQWGVAEGQGNLPSSEIFSFVENGSPLEFNFDVTTRVTLQISPNHLLRCYTTPAPTFADLDHIYVIGYQSDWAAPREENASLFPTLPAVQPGVFQGKVHCPPSEPNSFTPTAQFRFATVLKGWTRDGMLGSNYDDFYVESVGFEGNDNIVSDIIKDGLGNWGLLDWGNRDLDLEMIVDTNTMTLTIVNPCGAGVEGISSDTDADCKWFNLQGVQVASPEKGTYIRVQNGKSTKVIL